MYSKELLKGTLKPMILQLLQEKGRMYGYEIAQEVKMRSKDTILIKEGSLYPGLHSLAKDGLVIVESEKYGGRVRKYYQLSATGKEKLPVLLKELEAFIASLQLVFNFQPNGHAL